MAILGISILRHRNPYLYKQTSGQSLTVVPTGREKRGKLRIKNIYFSYSRKENILLWPNCQAVNKKSLLIHNNLVPVYML